MRKSSDFSLGFIHEGFGQLTLESWQEDGDLMQNIRTFTEKAQTWNKHVFGDIFRKKRRIMLRLEGISANLSFKAMLSWSIFRKIFGRSTKVFLSMRRPIGSNSLAVNGLIWVTNTQIISIAWGEDGGIRF